MIASDWGNEPFYARVCIWRVRRMSMLLTPGFYKINLLSLVYLVATVAGHSDDALAANLATPALSHVQVQINGESAAVRAGEQLDLIAGDVLRLAGAVLVSDPVRPVRVSLNFVGVPGRDSARVWDDTGMDINTATDVVAAHAVSKAENKYVVRAEVSGISVGSIFVRIFPPRLAFAEILVNGQARTLRDGETLRVAPDDQVKLIRFESNITNPSEVGFRFSRIAESGVLANGPGKALYEFVFSRGGRVFARIPVRVESSMRENELGEPKG